ncbi:MAG: VOC family protein [Bacillota bacterium]
MKVDFLDHLVLTVLNLERTIDFYKRLLGMHEITFGNNRKALVFGDQKINLHEYGNEYEPKAKITYPGSADLCFITTTPINKYKKYLISHGVSVEEGPVKKMGAKGDMLSIYIRDPDENLIEISNYK